MGLMDDIRSKVLQWLLPGEYMNTDLRQRLTEYQTAYEYYRGNQARQMKVKVGQADDNLTTNYTQLVVDRSISMMLGSGIEFDLPGEAEDENQVYIDTIWDANRRNILLHNAAQYSSLYGTGYLKILPNALTLEENVLPRIVALDPRWLTIHTHPEDVQKVSGYETRFQITRDDRTVNRRELVALQPADDERFSDTWLISNYESTLGGNWQLIDEMVWPFDFAPIVHWQNLPLAGNVYGESDVDGIIELQDRINFVSSNISKIIRYNAHPFKFTSGVAFGQSMSWGPDEWITLTDPAARAELLEMESDLMSSAQYLLSLRQSLFDISRTVDITSLSDKLGALTNFGLRVLFTDSIAKIETKRRLMEDAITELNRRLLVLANAADTEPGDVVWPNALPVNLLEELQAAQVELDIGLVSKQTKAEELGRNWEIELERMQEQEAAADNVGAAILRAFSNGQ